jgi:hypothetical protein
MKLTVSVLPKTIAKRLIIGVIILTVLGLAVQIGKYVFNYRADWTRMYNLDREMNLPTWYSALMLAFCAILLAVIAIGKKAEHNRYSLHWRFLSNIFWFLAIDEVMSIHELLIIPDLSKHLPPIFHSFWVLPGTIAVAYFIKQYWKFTFDLPRQSRFYFILAATLYIGGALGMEIIGGVYADSEGQQNLGYALFTTVEEVMEPLGIVTFIYALLHYIGNWADNLEVQVKFLGVNRESQP